MNQPKIINDIQENIASVITQDSPLGRSLWRMLLEQHPVDIANLLSELDKESSQNLFLLLPKELRTEIFRVSSLPMQSTILNFLGEHEKAEALYSLGIDDLADLFDYVSDSDLKKYLNLLHRKAREQVISLLQFDSESAGGIMETEVLTLMQDFTVEKSVKILQRLRPRKEVHHHIYVTNKQHQLVGYVSLEDLVLNTPETRISSFLSKNELVVHVDQDREDVAKQMMHYKLTSAPVVGDENYFLGVIPSETLVDILVREATEDVQKMAALTPMKQAYFQTSFFKLLYNRAYILIALLMAESFSGTILRAYEETLCGILMFFIPMLISTGGNTSGQTSAVVIQGMATGEIHPGNIRRFLKRELLTALALSAILAIAAFIRVYFTYRLLYESIAISCSVGVVVLFAVSLGSVIPIILKRLNIDPAFSAGPFLATLMDILGILIYCYLSRLILF